MKKVFTVLALIFSIATYAQDFPLYDSVPQIDSSKISITVSLNAEQHYLIIDFLQDVKSPIIADYIKQVVQQTDTIYNPTKVITVVTESGLVPEIYKLLSIQREGVTAQPNQDMKVALFPQLDGYTWIAKEIARIDAENTSLRQQRISRGFQYARSLKY